MTDFWQFEKSKNPQTRINTVFLKKSTIRRTVVIRIVYTLKR